MARYKKRSFNKTLIVLICAVLITATVFSTAVYFSKWHSTPALSPQDQTAQTDKPPQDEEPKDPADSENKEPDNTQNNNDNQNNNNGNNDSENNEQTVPPDNKPQYTLSECDETVYTTIDLNKRSEPLATSDKLGVAYTGTALHRVATTDTNWSKIEKDGEYFWVHSGYVTTEKPLSILPEPVYENKLTGMARVEQIDKYLNSDELRLVNKNNPLGKDFAPKVVELNTIYSSTGNRRRFDERYADKLTAMIKALRSLGYKNTYFASAYRDYSTQYNSYWTEVKKYVAKGMSQSEAEKYVSTIVAIPGSSEHQYGLAVDISDGGSLLGSRIEALGYAKWLKANSYLYGFVLRYPKDKTEITEIIYEPWHFRYVSEVHAKIMYDNNWCLEEYREQLKKEKEEILKSLGE